MNNKPVDRGDWKVDAVRGIVEIGLRLVDTGRFTHLLVLIALGLLGSVVYKLPASGLEEVFVRSIGLFEHSDTTIAVLAVVGGVEFATILALGSTLVFMRGHYQNEIARMAEQKRQLEETLIPARPSHMSDQPEAGLLIPADALDTKDS